MKNICIALLLLISFNLNAQFGGTCPPDVLTERFLKTKTLILLTGNEKFDTNLAKGFKEFWTLTEYDFIESEKEIDTKDKSISYLIPIKMTITDAYTTQHYKRYGLVIGGEESFLYRNVADVILDNFGYEKFVTEAGYRAFGMPKLMQDFIQMRIDGEKISGATITKVRYTAGIVYNKKSTNIKAKTLLIDKKQLKSGKYYPYGKKKSYSPDKFKKMYNGKVKFVTTAELEEAINQRNPNFTYLLTVCSRKKYILVVDCASASLWYNGYQPIGIGITSKDIKRLSKSVNGKVVVKPN